MKIRLYFVICFCFSALFCSKAWAQEVNLEKKDTTYWKGEYQSGANLNQATFSNNWKAGGSNSMSVGGLFHGTATYQHEKALWTNNLQLDYGFQKLSGGDSRKTLDRLFYDTKSVYNVRKTVSVFFSANLVTQFAQGFKYAKDAGGNDTQTLVSKFFAPAYLVEALGLEYHPADYFSMDFGLGGLRHTFVSDTTLHRNVPNNYGVPLGKTMRTQAIFQLATNFNKEIMKNVSVKIRYAALLDYDKPQLSNVVHRVDLGMNAKVNKWVSASLTSILLYDIDQDTNLQYNQMLGVGILYTFTK